MEKKFTPAPWGVSYGNEGSIFGDLRNPKHAGDYPYIGTVAGIKPNGVEHTECAANERLVIASPEMYELLEKILQALNNAPLDWLETAELQIASNQIEPLLKRISNE